jgi:hypothetical protein
LGGSAFLPPLPCGERIEVRGVLVRPKIFDMLFKDDRMFVLEVSAVTTGSLTSNAPERKEWAVITRRNVSGYPPFRTDSFPTRVEAIDYYKKIVVETPLISLDNQPQNPSPSIEEYTAWLVSEKLYDPVLNPSAQVTSDV